MLSVFQTPSFALTALGTHAGKLLALPAGNNVYMYTEDGTLTNTITLLPTSGCGAPICFWQGITSDGVSLYVGDNDSGKVLRFNMSGQQTGDFDTGLAGGLSGLTYDVGSGTLWVASGFGFGAPPSGIYEFSNAGVLLGSFATPGIPPSAGIAVIPAAVPEPTTVALHRSRWSLAVPAEADRAFVTAAAYRTNAVISLPEPFHLAP